MTNPQTEELLKKIKNCYLIDDQAHENEEALEILSQALSQVRKEERQRITKTYNRWVKVMAFEANRYIATKDNKPYIKGYDNYLKDVFTQGILSELEIEDLSQPPQKEEV